MPIVRDATKEEFDRLEDIDLREREAAEIVAKREHEYRLAKLKYSTAGRYRMWGRVLIGFAKAPAWAILAVTARKELPDYWKKFLDI